MHRPNPGAHLVRPGHPRHNVAQNTLPGYVVVPALALPRDEPDPTRPHVAYARIEQPPGRSGPRIQGLKRRSKQIEDELLKPRALALPDFAAPLQLADALVERSFNQFRLGRSGGTACQEINDLDAAPCLLPTACSFERSPRFARTVFIRPRLTTTAVPVGLQFLTPARVSPTP